METVGQIIPPLPIHPQRPSFPSCPFVEILYPPSRFFSDPSVEIFLPFRPSWISSSPYPTLGEPLSIPRQPLRAPSPFFVPLRG